MFIVMHCMGLPFNGETIKNESLGGSETAAYYVAKELASKGHKVTLFTNSQDEGEFDGVNYVFAGNSTQHQPLGDRFHFYAENTPHDVLIIQRHPSSFQYAWASKIKLWWVHDLAQMRNNQAVQANLWNIDGILTVSEFHKQQYVDVYGINPDIIFPIQNGIDLNLYRDDLERDPPYYLSKIEKQVKLLYSSRPERGLEHLVKQGGIMERLAEKDSKYHLYVCAYENTTAQTEQYYQFLKQRCGELENVTLLGSLTKQELADVMRQCDLMVYPTPNSNQPNFEEVSCITAMECMAAGLPFLSSERGALPETCAESGSILLPPDKDGLPDIELFVDAIAGMPFGKLEAAQAAQLAAAKRYSWDKAADMLMGHIMTCMNKNRSNAARMRHMLQMSDIYALENFVNDRILESTDTNLIENGVISELEDCYGFAFNNNWSAHYENYYQYEEDRGIVYGAENLDGNGRFEHVSSIVGRLPVGSTVLDYGCAHGHYTINLAKRFPDKFFTGVDITRSNVDKANEWCKQEGITNANFINGSIPQDTRTGLIKVNAESGAEIQPIPLADCIIAAEVLEHVGDAGYYVDTLCNYLKDDNSLMVITTPFGAWEAMGYEEHYPWRAHVHHFDRPDLHDLWGHFPEFNIALAPSGKSKWGSTLGSYITTFKKPDAFSSSMVVDYDRKFNEMVPRQTLSLCMIVKDAEDTLKRSLDSINGIVDEIIIAIDETTTDRTETIIDDWVSDLKGNWPIVKKIRVKSAMEIGFDEARNLSIEKASGDWILWMDSDEILINAKNIYKYLQNNQFDGYAIKQHHFAVEPLGVLKTDLPCRVFRNNKGIKFYGVVHEHPEKVLNDGVGFVQLLPDIEIAHHGYTTESIRRKRFDRNINLLVRDRKKYPERVLGKFLWLRDLSQMCKYELEVNGGTITEDMIERAEQGIKIWEELLADNHLRMIVDGIDFYSLLAKITGNGFEMGLMLDTSKTGNIKLEQALPVIAHFATKQHAEDLIKALFNEKVKDYGSKYF